MLSRRLVFTSLIFATPWAAELRADEPPSAGPAADGQQIERLIRQLGSDTFEERESASRALAHVGGPALGALRKAASTSPDAEVRRRAVALVNAIENGLDQLLANYQAFGLPLPPKDAPLVRFEVRPGYTETIIDHRQNDHKEITTYPPRYALAFLIGPAEKDHEAKLLRGTTTWNREPKQVGDSLGQQLTAEYLLANMPDSDESLLLALQLHARGWDAADSLFQLRLRDGSNHRPRTELRLLAWEYWDRRLTDTADDVWPAAARQMKSLLADEPDLDTPDNRHLLKSLEAALVPPTAKPGSVEALIDDLVHAGSTNHDDDRFTGRPVDERFARVFNLGFEGVSALLEHLDDDRLTHYLEPPPMFYSGPGFSFPQPYHSRVGDMASDILRTFAGQDAAKHWPHDRNDRATEIRLAHDWWDEARKQGEEAYFAAHLFPPADDVLPSGDQQPELGIVRLLGKKYPRRLAALYRDLLDSRPLMRSWPLTEALAASSLPRDDKVELLALGGRNKCLEHRRAALWELKELDPERFVSLLTATLDDLPRTPTRPYPECCERTFATLVCAADDPRAWRALERAARRADPGLRMEMLASTSYPTPTPAQRRPRLAFLASFLDDETVRDVTTDKKMFAGIYAGAWIPRMEIRDFAALRISQVVETPADPTDEWTSLDWAKLREQMRATVKRVLGDEMKE